MIEDSKMDIVLVRVMLLCHSRILRYDFGKTDMLMDNVYGTIRKDSRLERYLGLGEDRFWIV